MAIGQQPYQQGGRQMSDPVRWGVVGCARIAINQVIPGILQAPGAELVAVASRTPAKAAETAARFGVRKAYGSYEELLRDPEIEAVYIPLPNHLHRPWSIAALQAGKHVLCEKPIALNATEARQMQQAAQETGRYLLEGFAYRFGPIIRKAMEIVHQGTLGELQMLHSSLNFALPQDPQDVRLQADIGGGALYDVGCYALNVQRMLAGREPRSAWATFDWSEPFRVDLSGIGYLDWGEHLRGTFDFGFRAPGGSFFRAVGTRGTLTAPYGFAAPEGQAGLLLTVGGETQPLLLPNANGYMLEVQDLSEAVRGLHPPLYAWEPLDATMRVIDACYAANKLANAVEV
jgi:D-xylose 1-dehydrogenase (NADP+, D-xylono-1,5-lactone-forming)